VPVTRICTRTLLLQTRCRPSTDAAWLSIDGRVLFKATVAASETYNTALAHHLRDRLGVRFAERTDTDPGKRPIREIVGVDPALNQRWSSRRLLIKDRQGELAAHFQDDHGRPPTPVEALQLAQQATLETRDAKHEPRSLAEQRTAWHAQAVETLGGPDAVEAMINNTLNPISIKSLALDAGWVSATVEKVLAAVEEHRSTWQSWHVRAEALRHIRAAEVDIDKVDQLVELLVAEVLQTRSVALTRTEDGISEPAALRRADGSSVYTVAGSELFTSARILAAEQRLVGTAARMDGRIVAAETVELALLEAAANGTRLRCRAGRAGSRHVHLRGAAAARDRPRRRRQNHRHAHPGTGVERQRRPRGRVGAVRRRGGAAPRRHRCTSRNVGEADLVH
jgi:limonene-1,2-epoxide hydrolase